MISTLTTASMSDQVEHRFARKRAGDGVGVHEELGREERGGARGIDRLELDDEVNVSRHARLGIVSGGDGAGEHVGYAGSVEPRGDEFGGR